MNLGSALLDKRRALLAPRTRAIYDEAIEGGLSGDVSAIQDVRARVLLARMSLLSEEEKQKLLEIFDATSDYLEKEIRRRRM